MRTRTAITITALLLFVLAAAWAQEQPSAAGTNSSASASLSPDASAKSPVDESGFQSRHPRYKLQLGDTFDVSFDLSPEFNQTVTVQPDGYITLRSVEGIRVEGQTLPEVINSLQNAYGKILHDPVINVELKDFEKPYFIVGGEVGHPGKFDLRGDTSATEAVAIAGGLRDSAKHSQVVLFHRVPDGWAQVKKLNMKKMLKDGNLDEDAYLQPGDFLYVPKNTMSKIARFIPSSSVGMYTNPLQH